MKFKMKKNEVWNEKKWCLKWKKWSLEKQKTKKKWKKTEKMKNKWKQKNDWKTKWKKWSYKWKPKWKINEKIILNISNLWLDANHIRQVGGLLSFWTKHDKAICIREFLGIQSPKFSEVPAEFEHDANSWDAKLPPRVPTMGPSIPNPC